MHNSSLLLGRWEKPYIYSNQAGRETKHLSQVAAPYAKHQTTTDQHPIVRPLCTPPLSLDCEQPASAIQLSAYLLK